MKKNLVHFKARSILSLPLRFEASISIWGGCGGLIGFADLYAVECADAETKPIVKPACDATTLIRIPSQKRLSTVRISVRRRKRYCHNSEVQHILGDRAYCGLLLWGAIVKQQSQLVTIHKDNQPQYVHK